MLRIIVVDGAEAIYLDVDNLCDAVSFYELLLSFYAERGVNYAVHLVYADNGKDVSA